MPPMSREKQNTVVQEFKNVEEFISDDETEKIILPTEG